VPLGAVHLDARLVRKLRRHPGGDEGFAGSNGAVMNVDAAHETPAKCGGWIGKVEREPWLK
jgi:hypothetical protein